MIQGISAFIINLDFFFFFLPEIIREFDLIHPVINLLLLSVVLALGLAC